MSLRAPGFASKNVHSSPNPVVNCDSSVDILRHMEKADVKYLCICVSLYPLTQSNTIERRSQLLPGGVSEFTRRSVSSNCEQSSCSRSQCRGFGSESYSRPFRCKAVTISLYHHATAIVGEGIAQGLYVTARGGIRP
jgi:hypothetical protein